MKIHFKILRFSKDPKDGTSFIDDYNMTLLDWEDPINERPIDERYFIRETWSGVWCRHGKSTADQLGSSHPREYWIDTNLFNPEKDSKYMGYYEKQWITYGIKLGTQRERDKLITTILE